MDRTEASGRDPPPLENGDRLTRAEFERRYEAMPDLKKAELIEGVVYMPSPVRHEQHGRPHSHSLPGLAIYVAATPGVEAGDNGSVRLDMDNEPQPDAFLIIDPECGGQARISEDDYVEGAPELVAEVASSSVSYDLARSCTSIGATACASTWSGECWTGRSTGSCSARAATSRLPLCRRNCGDVFPGLWLDPAALLGRPRGRPRGLQRGMQTPEHADFVARWPGRSGVREARTGATRRPMSHERPIVPRTRLVALNARIRAAAGATSPGCSTSANRSPSPAIPSPTRMPRILLVGQAPGLRATLHDRPFAGLAGEKLRDWLEQGGIPREDFYRSVHFAAVTRCYPGRLPGAKGDRVPSPREQALCRPWLDELIATSSPGDPARRPAGDPDLPRAREVLDGRRRHLRGTRRRALHPLAPPSGVSRWHPNEAGGSSSRGCMSSVPVPPRAE